MIRDAAVYLLNHLVLTPNGWDPFELTFDLGNKDALREVPNSPGVYLLSTPGHFFAYPGGYSSVLYIGRSTGSQGLRRRLSDHHKYTEQVRDGSAGTRFYARYEWAATYGALASYVCSPQGEGEAKGIEHELLRVFADAFRAAPVANAQSAWGFPA